MEDAIKKASVGGSKEEHEKANTTVVAEQAEQVKPAKIKKTKDV